MRGPANVRTIRYGPGDSQVGDLHLPDAHRPAVVCLLHGGFWRLPYGREELDPVARDLAARGYAVWNLEYRRLGEAGGGWPGTFEDVAAGIDRLAELAAEGIALDLRRVVVAGHSAGGHLAFWAAARRAPVAGPAGPRRVAPAAAAALAAILDLRALFAADAGRDAVRELLGGSPDERPAVYDAASPLARLPLGVPQLVLHGTADEVLPVATARAYARAARAAGDAVDFLELPGAGHMDPLDPGGATHAALRDWIGRVAGEPAADARAR